jgi:hypothetical protein
MPDQAVPASTTVEVAVAVRKFHNRVWPRRQTLVSSITAISVVSKLV